MPTTVYQVSPAANPTLNLGGDIAFAAAAAHGTGINLHNTFLDIGTVAKGAIDSIQYVMFEVPEDAGAEFDSIQFKLNFELLNGTTGAHPFWMGFLATDGVWDNQADFLPLGLRVYGTVNLFPQAPAASHVNWASGSATFADAFDTNQGFVAGDPVTFGSVGTGSTYEDNQFLTDFQAAFDANESGRSVRGVPILLHLYPQLAGNQRMWRFSSQNHATEALRPTLTLVTNDAPVVEITNPAAPLEVASGTNVNFVGTSNDSDDGDISSGIVWTSNIQGSGLGTGASINVSDLIVGVHTITATSTDAGSLVGTDTVQVTVTEAPGVPVKRIITISDTAVIVTRDLTAAQVVNAATSKAVSVPAPQIGATQDSATIGVTQKDTTITAEISEES